MKLRYYDMLIQHALHSSAYLDVAKYYHKIWETPSVKEDESDKGRVVCFKLAVYSRVVNFPLPGFGTYRVLRCPCPAR